MNLINRTLLSVREIIFGLEDGLVSTLGVVTGVAEGTNNQAIIILTGLVIVSVESLSMAAGVYLSNKSENQFLARRLKLKRKKVHDIKDHLEELDDKRPLSDSSFMFFSYFVGGSIPVLPYLFLQPASGVVVSVFLTVATLFAIGAVKGKIVGVSILRSGLEMMAVSIAAAGIGFTVGKVAGQLLPIN